MTGFNRGQHLPDEKKAEVLAFIRGQIVEQGPALRGTHTVQLLEKTLGIRISHPTFMRYYREVVETDKHQRNPKPAEAFEMPFDTSIARVGAAQVIPEIFSTQQISEQEIADLKADEAEERERAANKLIGEVNHLEEGLLGIGGQTSAIGISEEHLDRATWSGKDKQRDLATRVDPELLRRRTTHPEVEVEVRPSIPLPSQSGDVVDLSALNLVTNLEKRHAQLLRELAAVEALMGFYAGGAV